MPNLCSYEMKAKGKPENILTLAKWLKANYNYGEENKGLKCWTLKDGVSRYGNINEEDKIPCEHHIGYRVFEADICDENELKKGELLIFGDCAWSVYSCMFKGSHTYMNDYKKEENFAISIVDASRVLDLDIEIFSEEPGCCFAEHYLIRKGELEVDECVDFHEYLIDEYETKEDAEKDPEIQISDEEWKNTVDNDCWLRRGGFDYEYVI